MEREDLAALRSLVDGVEGEEWPRWLGHLPWDVREVYRRIVVDARLELATLERVA